MQCDNNGDDHVKDLFSSFRITIVRAFGIPQFFLLVSTNTPCFKPSQTEQYSTHLLWSDGKVSRSWCLISAQIIYLTYLQQTVAHACSNWIWHSAVLLIETGWYFSQN